MSPQQRLHDFFVGVMRAQGLAPAVFFGNDQREKKAQAPPVIVYSFDGDETISTDDGDVVVEEIYAVQVSSRTRTAEADRSALVRQVLDHANRSEEITVHTEESDRDDDLDMAYQVLEVRLAPYDSDDPLVQRHARITRGAPAQGITFNGKRLLW